MRGSKCRPLSEMMCDSARVSLHAGRYGRGARRQRNALAAQPVGIAAAVPFLVVVLGDFQRPP